MSIPITQRIPMKPLLLAISATITAAAIFTGIIMLANAMGREATQRRESITTQIDTLRTEHAAEIDAIRKDLAAATLERHAGGCEIAAGLAKAEGKQ